MSVETSRVSLGLGEAYINNVRVGNLQSNLSINYTKEFAEKIPGDMINIVKRELVGEKMELSLEVGDLKMSQLINAMGLTMSTTGLTGTTTLRVVQEVQLGASTTTWKTLAEHAVSATNVVLESLDYQTKHLKGTDFSVTSSTGACAKIKPKSASFKRKYVLATYDYADASALRIHFGGKVTNKEFALKFVHKKSNGKFIQLTLPKCQFKGDFPLTFNEKDYASYTLSFVAVADATLAKGSRLGRIVEER